MTERCQQKFSEKFANKNYIIGAGILGATIAVLYFYRFHLISIVLGYVLGCLATFYSLNLVLQYLVDILKCHFITKHVNKQRQTTVFKDCATCGSKECTRHDDEPAMEPWVGLQTHKQLDQAIEDFYNAILEQFVNSWYSKITLQPFFVDELRHQLRYASACLLQRAIKIDYSQFITSRLIPCALWHYTVCTFGQQLPNLAVHPAASSRSKELQYLRSITNAIMPYLIKSNEYNNSVFRVLIREIFAGWVLLSLTDVLADPYILNTLVILATGDETMAQLPTTPNYKVEFLENFVRQTDSVYLKRLKLLRLDLEQVINDQEYLYAFMQFMKTTNHIQLLQFYKDIKSFQTKLLNPELTREELVYIQEESKGIYNRYLDTSSPGCVALQPGLALELCTLLNVDRVDVKSLQTSRALYQAARQSHAILEKIMLPKFLHSEEYYNLIIGSRIPTGYQKQMSHRYQQRQARLKSAIKLQTLDGQVLDTVSNSSDLSDGDDNMDLLKYLDSIAADTTEQDLSNYKVVLTNVETVLQPPPRRGTVRVFTVTVHQLDPDIGARLWSVVRSEHDFHLLKSKLQEFHGERIMRDLPLPSRRDNSPLETIRYKYEDFLQRLLQKTLLQTSELLHLFLTVEGDFSLVVQASTLNANSSDLTNIYQSVTHRLRKEKGQHLESFLRNLLISSDMDRYQALKQGTGHIEEGLEITEDAAVEQVATERVRNARNIHNSVFTNNFDMENVVIEKRDAKYQDVVVGFTQCFMYLLTKVFNARSLICNIIGTLLSASRRVVDYWFNQTLNRKLCELLCERRLAHLISLGHGLLFGKKTFTREDPTEHRELARKQLMQCIPSVATLTLGTGLPIAVHTAFEIVQKPQLNKQLVYNLLDLCILELFPELRDENNSSIKTRS